MNRVRNADEFLLRWRRIREQYDNIFVPHIAEVRKKYAGREEEEFINQHLEAHARAYNVNALLAAVNWRLDARPEEGLPNLIPEAPIRSEERGSIRFLDYLGLERQTKAPLLIVETKRPSAQLPRTSEPAATYSEVLSRGLAGESLNGEWNKWLRDLRDYICSAYAHAQRVLRRAVITNGDWLILFLDPSDAFLDTGTHAPTRILVFTDRFDIQSRYCELFRHLEHGQVSGEIPPLTPSELPFYVNGAAVDRAMHGIRLCYLEQYHLYHYLPVIKVAPVVFVRSRYSSWMRIEAPPQVYELPHESSRIPEHLSDVERAAKNLFDQVNHRLGISLKAFPLSRHYEDEEAFAALRGVVECRENEYLVITGDKTHYLLPQASISNCPYHAWTKANAAVSPSNPGPIMIPSIAPRCFFVSGELHHCAHRDVGSAKATQITKENLLQCGPRSGEEGQAFCEIWRFEQHLCCRICVFEEVCTKATIFQLPC